MMIEFRVPGIAAPQGSKKAFRTRGGRIALVESCARVKPYRATVALAAREAWVDVPTNGTVGVSIAFTFIRPASHYNAKGVLRAGAATHPGKGIGDIDKLCRAVLDGLTGVIYADDSQVVSLVATKAYGNTAETRISIYITP
jgi:Holliday junction resolvase RusA-like endonuclease